MCGELDEEGGSNSLEEALYNRFLLHTRAVLEKQQARAGKGAADPVIGALDKLFTDALTRCSTDTEKADPGQRYAVMSMQPLVFARLAGFLAAHCALQEDPLRKVIEAMMHGYAEAEQVETGHGHDHDHGDSQGHFGHTH